MMPSGGALIERWPPRLRRGSACPLGRRAAASQQRTLDGPRPAKRVTVANRNLGAHDKNQKVQVGEPAAKGGHAGRLGDARARGPRGRGSGGRRRHPVGVGAGGDRSEAGRWVMGESEWDRELVDAFAHKRAKEEAWNRDWADWVTRASLDALSGDSGRFEVRAVPRLPADARPERHRGARLVEGHRRDASHRGEFADDLLRQRLRGGATEHRRRPPRGEDAPRFGEPDGAKARQGGREAVARPVARRRSHGTQASISARRMRRSSRACTRYRARR